MAEIKSTLELALERTKKFSLSEKDREEIRQKEIQQRILSFFHRYRDNHLPLHDIQKELERMDEKTRHSVREGLLSLWTEGLSLDEQGEKFLKGIEFLIRKEMGAVQEAFHQLRIQYQEEQIQIRQKMKALLIASLKEEGIGGDAVDPNVEANDLWKEETSRLNQQFHARLESIKQQISTL